ncbi:hypothetical protein G6F43_012057 [Rhizopus delemar]|nr:hypothetical protein G6F43_012057 [Rhizopus delemar]
MMTLICRLPSFDLSPGWPARWFLDLPLSAILTSIHPASGRPSTVELSTLSLRYLLSDLISWEQTRNTLVLRTLRSTKLKAIARELFPPAGPSEATLQLPTFFCCFLNTPEQEAYPPVLFSPENLTGYHLALTGYYVQDITLEDIPQTIHPPLRLPAEIILSSVWKTFWALPLPQAAITPWCRLLHNSIGVASKLFRWNPTSFPSPLCRF